MMRRYITQDRERVSVGFDVRITGNNDQVDRRRLYKTLHSKSSSMWDSIGWGFDRKGPLGVLRLMRYDEGSI